MMKWIIRFLKIGLRLTGIVCVLFIIAAILFDQFVQFRLSDDELLHFFTKHQVKGEVRYYMSHERRIRYVAVGNDTLPVILFIHGAPSSLSIFKDYFIDSTFLRRFRMYAVDRPGYGYSGLGYPEPSIEQQAAMIKPILDSLHQIHRPVLIVAASFGTSIACRIAMDYPRLVDGLVLTGPSLAPGREKTFWFTPYIESRWINWWVPRMLRSANTEKLHHGEQLTKMLPFWNRIRIPVTYLQGAKDELIDTSNAGFAREKLVSVPLLKIHFFPGRPHFIPFTEHAYIRNAILQMQDSVDSLQTRR